VNKIKEFASFGYDVAILREALMLSGMINCFFGFFEMALAQYKKLADLGTESLNAEDKKNGFQGMARCY
jgi:hypothetical protein